MRRVEGRLVLSATDLTDFLACAHLTALERDVAEGVRVRPERAEPELAAVLARRGTEHEARHLAQLRAAGLSVVEVDGDATSLAGLRAMEARTAAAMLGGVDVIYQAAFFDGHWQGRADFLRRVEATTELGAHGYEVHDAKLARHVKAGALLQMADYSAHVARIQGVSPELIHVVLGDGRLESHPLRDVAAYHRTARRRLEEALASAGVTYPEPVEHCDVCPWSAHCQARWRADDHLSLVANIRRDQSRKLVAAGIPTLHALAVSAADSPVSGLREATVAVLHDQAALQVQGAQSGVVEYRLRPDSPPGHGLAALPEPTRGDLFFDMEGDPFSVDGGIEYLFGILDTGVQPAAFTAFWGHDSAAEKQAFEQLVDFVVARLDHNPQLHVFHYAAYEATALKRLAGRHATREDAVDRFLRGGVLVDLHSVVRKAVRVSTEGYSLKELERLYMAPRAEVITGATQSVVAYERWLDSRDPAILDEIARYNEVDCRSTLALRDWLEARREELSRATGVSVPRPPPRDAAPPPNAAQVTAEVQRLVEALMAGGDGAPHGRGERQAARELLANLLDWHRREERPGWWGWFARLEMTDIELHDDSEAIGGLAYEGVVGTVKQSLIHRYRFDPAQEHKLGVGDQPADPRTGKSAGTIHALDSTTGIVDLRRGRHSLVPHPSALVPAQPLVGTPMREALARLAGWVAANGVDAPGRYRAARDLLLRRPPRLRASQAAQLGLGGPAAAALRGREETVVEAASRLGLALDGGTLAMQGPPGSGKTYTAAQLIVDLVKDRRRAGITAMSHRAIGKLLAEVHAVAAARGVTLRMLQKADDEQRCDLPGVRFATANEAVVDALSSGELDVVAGTCWLFSAAEMEETIDTLVVDEAGQMSLANVIAMSGAARNLVLCGDPQQLAQPLQGSHPDGAERSALEHVLDGRRTIAEDRGLFLDITRRMHPQVCEFVSNAFYEDRLHAFPNCELQQLSAPAPLGGAGLRWAPVVHTGNRSRSFEEATAVATLIDDLLHSDWTGQDGRRRALGSSDVLVVAPYNAQVHCLSDALPPGVAVGTVDRFQGQEAPVTVYSMATSSAADLPRAFEFLYSLNRLNVAVSRAQGLAVLVCSPALLDVVCHTPEQVRQVNALCRFIELAELLQTADSAAAAAPTPLPI